MKENHQQLTGLTGLRGFFAIWVLGLHLITGLLIDHVPVDLIIPRWMIHFFDNGFWGVDGFFILSGFILSYSYSAKLNQTFNFKNITHYIWNRLARFFPVHVIILLIYVLIQTSGIHLIQQECIPTAPSPLNCQASVAEIAAGTSSCPNQTVIQTTPCERFSKKNFLKHLFLISSWSWNADLTWNFPAWSISSEWFVYLLFPFIILAVSHIHSPKIAFLIAILSLAMMTFILKYRGYAPLGLDPEIGLVRVTGEFISGCFFYRFYRGQNFKKNFWFPVGLVCMTLLLFSGQTFIRYFFSLLLALLILSVAENNNPISRFFSKPKMTWLGRISYSLYMSQLLTLELLGVIFSGTETNKTQLGLTEVAIMLVFMTFSTLSVAAVFYYFIEEPCRLFMKKLLQNT